MSRHKIITLLVALVALLALLAPQPALACSCAPPGTPAEEMARSSAVLAGRVTRVDVPHAVIESSADLVQVTLDVRQVWKGPANHTVALVTARSSASCGFEFRQGEEYIVYATAEEGAMHVSLCSRTAELSAAAEDLAALGPGTTLGADGSAGGLDPDLTPLVFTGIATVAVLFVATIAVAVVLQRRRA